MEDATETTDTPPRRRHLTTAEKRNLFLAVEEVNEAIADNTKQREELDRLRSSRVKAIFDVMGRGPFIFEGRKIEIGHRGDNYYFKEYRRIAAESV
jgi:hypothetical protein